MTPAHLLIDLVDTGMLEALGKDTEDREPLRGKAVAIRPQASYQFVYSVFGLCHVMASRYYLGIILSQSTRDTRARQAPGHRRSTSPPPQTLG